MFIQHLPSRNIVGNRRDIRYCFIDNSISLIQSISLILSSFRALNLSVRDNRKMPKFLPNAKVLYIVRFSILKHINMAINK